MKSHVAALSVLFAAGCAAPAPLEYLKDRTARVDVFSGNSPHTRAIIVDFGSAPSLANGLACPRIEKATWRGNTVTAYRPGDFAMDTFMPMRDLCEGPVFILEEPDSETRPGTFEARDASGTIRLEFDVNGVAAMVPVDPALLPGAQLESGGHAVLTAAAPMGPLEGARLDSPGATLDDRVTMEQVQQPDGSLRVTLRNTSYNAATVRVLASSSIRGPALTCVGVHDCPVEVGVDLASPEFTVLPGR